MGNPGVFWANPYPYPRKPVPVTTGTGFSRYRYGFVTNPRVFSIDHKFLTDFKL